MARAEAGRVPHDTHPCSTNSAADPRARQQTAPCRGYSTSNGCFHCITCCSGGLSWMQVDSLRRMHGADKGSWGPQGRHNVVEYFEYYRHAQMVRGGRWRPSWHGDCSSSLSARRRTMQLSLLVPASATNVQDDSAAQYVGPVRLGHFQPAAMQTATDRSGCGRLEHRERHMMVEVAI